MGRRRGRKWFSRIVGVIASLTALCLARNNVEAAEEAPKSCPSGAGHESVRDRSLMVVSTLDGRVSALDVGDSGQLVWSVQADARPLLSSSISKMEVTRDGVRTRLIPSLDGGLYQYDGESIEAVPMTAETLLSSSFRLSDNTIMIGGKDIRTYGLDPLTGKIRYLCTMAGCQDVSPGDPAQDDNLIVITRNTQTVRAVDARLGLEKWNFSVGRHEVEVIDGSKPSRPGEIDEEDDDGVTISPCNSGEDEGVEEENFLKVIVPDGMVVALNPEDSTSVKWQHKFSSPVANAWLMQAGVLKKMSLFDTRYVPAISSFIPSDVEERNEEPLLYVGLHQNQLYVQPSDQLQESVSQAATNGLQAALPRISWRPYLNTAPSRTPILNNKQRPQITQGKDTKGEGEGEGEDGPGTSLTVWHENYPFDNGYYLFPDVTPSALPVDHPNSSQGSAETVMDIVLPASLWNWWKEVLAISLVTSVIVHFLLTRYIRHELPEVSRQSSTDSNSGIRTSESSQDLVEPPKQAEFTSRFLQDFQCLHCLGKGGFGVVFEAKNIVDDCNYAVKRICIPNREGQKERVIREVKALAKLEHVGIVRFFQAWLEAPPAGWQEERDKQLDDSECLTPTPCNTGAELSSVSRFPPDQASEPSLPKVSSKSLVQKLGILAEDYSSSLDQYNSLREGVSQEFSAHSNIDYSTDESGSFSYVGGEPERHLAEDEDSFSIEFKNSHSGIEKSTSGIPFKSYMDRNTQDGIRSDGDSFSIVFEDSGCKDKYSGGDFSQENHSEEIDSVAGFTDHSIRIDKSETSKNVVSKRTKSEPLDTKNQESQKGAPKMYLYIQMQLCRRETLKDWMCANTLNRDRAIILDIFDQIVSAVDYVHDFGLMHRDLKPSNIFFALDGSIKIGDFGLVTTLVEPQELVGDFGNASAKHTAEVGTQLYMSPEQISRKQYDHKVDIFSLGMILFELLYPFSTQMERIRTLVNIKRQVFPERFVREMPKEHGVVSWLLSEKPSERPTTKNILNSELLKDFAPRRVATRFRSRTLSSSSVNSTGS